MVKNYELCLGHPQPWYHGLQGKYGRQFNVTETTHYIEWCDLSLQNRTSPLTHYLKLTGFMWGHQLPAIIHKVTFHMVSWSLAAKRKNVLHFLSIFTPNLIWSNMVFQFSYHHSGFCGVEWSVALKMSVCLSVCLMTHNLPQHETVTFFLYNSIKTARHYLCPQEENA